MWQDHLADIFRGKKGFRGAYVLGNPGSNHAVTLTLWDSEADADAAHALQNVGPEVRGTALGEPKVEGYEVIFSV
jgi:heme-degrading monooxygenase HmoA